MLFEKKEKTAKLPFSAYSGSEPCVFISYAHADSDIVYPIIKELHMRNVHIWYDEGIDVGTEWPQKIADKILGCSKFILFISQAASNSNHVRQEINFANSKYKQILPVYIKPTQLNAGLEMTLSVFQAIFYYAFKNDELGFYNQLYAAITEGFIQADEEFTELIHFGETLLRLDEYGDRTLPPVIHLPEQGTFSIGRFDVSVGVKQSDFEFSKDKKNISRRHAVFECTPQGCTVTDLGSKAGTWVDMRKIPPHVPVLLASGCRVSFGNVGASYIFEC